MKTVYRIIGLITLMALLLGSYMIVGASPVSASSNSYYVSPTGNDTNPGTLTSPFQTITKALNTAVAGDTIYVRAGTYPGFEIDKSGIAIAGYSNEMPLISGGSGIKIAGASNVLVKGFDVMGVTSDWEGAITSLSGDYNVIDGNKVHDNTESGTTGILIVDGSYNRVLNNDVYNNNFVGIRIYGTSSSVMDGNEIGFNISHDQVLSGGNSDGIDIDAPLSQNTYIHDNIVYGNADDGLDTWNSSNNLIVRNIAYNQNGIGDGNGFKMGGWTGSVGGGNNTVIGNVSYNNKTAGFTTNGGYGSKYYNNVAYDNGSYGFDDGWRDFSCTVSTCPSVYIDNIGYDNVKGNFAAYIYTAISHNNIWYSDDGSANVLYNYVNYTSLSSFFAAKGLDNPNGGDLASLQANPQFTNPAAGSFTLLSSSPAIDRGDPSNPGQIAAINRVDIGAFEYGSSSSNYSTFTFIDVPPGYWAYKWIDAIYQAGITGGCNATPLMYCPSAPVTRAQMAVFLERAIHGSGFTPPNAPATFNDTATSIFSNWIEALKADGITNGCGNGDYCPLAPVTRDQMAVFLLRAKHGPSYIPPPATGTKFIDVSASNPFAAWIEELANEDISSGCSTSDYCPASPVTRDQMAVFIQQTFNLALP